MLSTNILASEGATEGVQWVKVIFAKFTEKEDLLWSLFSIKFQASDVQLYIKRL